MDQVARIAAPLPPPSTTKVASRFSPAGAAELQQFRAADAKVTAVPGRFSVSYLIEGARQLALVDLGSNADLERIERVAAWTGKPVGLVIATHLHFDHCLGIDAAAQRFGAPIALHPLACRNVREGKTPRPLQAMTALTVLPKTWVWQGLPLLAREDWRSGLQFGFPWSRNPFQAPLAAPLEDGRPVPGLAGWVALHTPGHADESLCLWHEDSGFLVAGDTVRNFQGGEWNDLLADEEAYRATRERLKALPVRAIFPGHGPALVGDGVIERLAEAA